MKPCIAAIPSLNRSIKAQKALAKGGIFSRVISLEPSVTKRGCAFGLEFPCTEEKNVRAILRRAGVHPSQFISPDGESHL